MYTAGRRDFARRLLRSPGSTMGWGGAGSRCVGMLGEKPQGMGRGTEGCGAHRRKVRNRERPTMEMVLPIRVRVFPDGGRGIANLSSLVEEPSDARLEEKQAAADEAEEKAGGGTPHPDAEEPDLMCVAVTLPCW